MGDYDLHPYGCGIQEVNFRGGDCGVDTVRARGVRGAEWIGREPAARREELVEGRDSRKAEYVATNIYINDGEIICSSIKKIERLLIEMNTKLDALAAQVKANSDVIDSAVLLINGIAQKITEAGVDQVKLDALVADLNTHDATLAAAVAANTPVAPTP